MSIQINWNDLEQVVVQNNKKVKKVIFEMGYSGKGNSNNSPYTTEQYRQYTLSELSGSDIEYVNLLDKYCSVAEQVAVLAVVEDIMYLAVKNIYNDTTEIREIALGEVYSYYSDIAYDTVGMFYAMTGK